MPVPDWVEEALSEELDDGEEVLETEVLKSGVMSDRVVAATQKRGFVLRKKKLGSPDWWDFSIQVPAGSTNGGSTHEKTWTEPLPEGVDAGTPDTDRPQAAEETEPPEPADDETEDAVETSAPDAGSDLTVLNGIGPAREDTLAGIEVTSFADLARADPDDVAEALQVGAERVDRWQTEVDLTGIHGIGPKRAESLREAGVQTLEDLAAGHPADIAEQLDVPAGTVESWQQEALGESASVEDFTEVDGVGDTRAKQLATLGLTTLHQLIDADPHELAEELGVRPDTVVDWQKGATEAPSSPTDLVEVSGIGPARAREIVRLGFLDRASFASANPSKIAEALEVSDQTVSEWQDAAGGS